MPKAVSLPVVSSSVKVIDLGRPLTRLQTTELVTINSSAAMGIGPYPRVIKRKDNRYMRPRSPQSPILQWKSPTVERISGSATARRAHDYVLTKVAELEVEALRIPGAITSHRQNVRTETASPGWSPNAKTTTDMETILKRPFLRVLDVHDVGNEAGISEDVFRAIFYTCRQCGRYMTERLSFSHNEDDTDIDFDDNVNDKKRNRANEDLSDTRTLAIGQEHTKCCKGEPPFQSAISDQFFFKGHRFAWQYRAFIFY
ncbi:hypothetical protein BDN70DRAFT_901209 [Pholiota conissans]|uniref:Uncharacterized protein n=1 Tax=Pholiota conissans TaxID=109636 RepID=A0A9P6CLV1_9AGAR|nr:hypothetical protein BDN70DRAFT_901209 [Pholiota conissans]